MDDKLNKIHTLTSYNIWLGNLIIAGADHYKTPNQGTIIEVFPFAQNFDKSEIELAPDTQWTDFFTKDADLTPDEVTAQIETMIATMFLDMGSIKDKLATRVRKNVYEITIRKNGKLRKLHMVYEFEQFVASQDNFHAALYVHDPEEFDIWRFNIDANEETIYRVVYPALKALPLRRASQIGH